MNDYFLFSVDDDGDLIIRQHDKESLKEDLVDYRNYKVANSIKEFNPRRATENMILIIKGEIIVPKPKEIVIEYEI